MSSTVIHLPRRRPVESVGAYSNLHGEFSLAAVASGLTTVAAAGHVFAMRWSSATGKKAVIRHIKADFLVTTAFTAAQAMGFDVAMARAYTASHTGGTAIDLSGNANKRRTAQDTSLFAANAVRVGGAGALTAGTHVIDANSFASGQFWCGAAGATGSLTLLDARDDGANTCRSPITLSQDEGIVIRNSILMGAGGVGNLTISVEWDEVTI